MSVDILTVFGKSHLSVILSASGEFSSCLNINMPISPLTDNKI